MNAPAPRTTRARSLRRSETDAEYRLWFELRARRLNGYKFVRQLPIGPYFADFACRTHHLVVELDGSQHAESPGDVLRTRVLNAKGFSVLRFWNDEILRERDAVLETILAVVERRITKGSDGDGLLCGLRFSQADPNEPPRPAPYDGDLSSSPLRGDGPGRGMRGFS